MKIWLSNSQLFLVIDDWCICCEIAMRWMSVDLIYDKSAVIQEMCRQGNKPLTEPMLTQIYGAIWRH